NVSEHAIPRPPGHDYAKLDDEATRLHVYLFTFLFRKACMNIITQHSCVLIMAVDNDTPPDDFSVI
ncbi:hypothetical protein BaRGS_00010184, partial [Batillaria attramentaria]